MDVVLWEMSFTNLNMLLATIPTVEKSKEEKVTETNDLSSIADFLGE